MRARGEPQVIVRALSTGGHSTRDLAFSLDGQTFFISIGSASNVDDPDTHPSEANRANILETTPEGHVENVEHALRIYASGIRNPVGADGSLFVTDDGSNAIWRVRYDAARRPYR
jgi:glucose/arabinose dehydrogenase